MARARKSHGRSGILGCTSREKHIETAPFEGDFREAGRDFQHPRPQQKLPGGVFWVAFPAWMQPKMTQEKDRPDRK